MAGEDDEKERAELAQALKGAKVSLKQGIVASVPKGKPISAKFEVEDGKLQLSVYTAKGGGFSEVLVDPKTGHLAKVEAIEGGEDITAAKAQADAMAKAKIRLGDAVDAAVKKNPEFRPVSVAPALKDGHPVADVAPHQRWRAQDCFGKARLSMPGAAAAKYVEAFMENVDRDTEGET